MKYYQISYKIYWKCKLISRKINDEIIFYNIHLIFIYNYLIILFKILVNLFLEINCYKYYKFFFIYFFNIYIY